MRNALKWILAGVVVALVIFGAGWVAKGLQVKARDAESAAARVRDSVRADSAYQVLRERYVADSANLALEAATAKALARGQQQAARLARDSAERATAAADQAHAALADAKTAADSVPHLVTEVAVLRVAIAAFRRSNDSLTNAARNWERAYHTDSLARIRDRALAEEHAALLRSQNAKLAEDLAAANRARGFHLSVKPPTLIALAVGVTATYLTCRSTSLCGKRE